MAAKIGQDVEVAIVPNSNGWTTHTAETIGATHGFLPTNISRANQTGEVVSMMSIGQLDETVHKLLRESGEYTIETYVRYNDPFWIFVAQLFGDATKSGTSFPITHTFNWQRYAPLSGGVTMAYRVNSDNSLIFEHPNLKVTNVTFKNLNGWLAADITVLNDTCLIGSDATADGTAFGNLTYTVTNAACILYNNMTYYQNALSDGDPAGGTALSDVSNLQLSISRPYDPMDDTIRGFTGASDAKRRAEPLITGDFPDIVLSYDRKTFPDAHIDDYRGENQYKGEIRFSQAIGANTHTISFELSKLQPFDIPDMPIQGNTRIGQSFNFRCADATSTPTGLSGTNPVHLIMVDSNNITYESYT